MSRSHGTVHSPLNGAYHVIQERNDLYKVDFKVENYDFSVSRGRRLEKGREFAISGHQRRIMDSPCLGDHRFSRSPLTAFPSVGCFVSANLLKLRHLRGFSVSSDSPCGEGRKDRFGRFSGRFPAVFLRLKRPPTFPLSQHYSTSNPAILHFFLNSVAWMSRERR